MNQTIKALIVDDEELGRKNLFFALKEHPNWEVIGQAASVANARLILATERVDLIFLDIQMPRETGLSLARELCQQAETPLVIFVTAFNEHAIEAFDLHALDYLLKPLDDQRLMLALDRAEAMLKLRQQADYAKALRLYVHTEEQQSLDRAPDYWDQVSIRSIGSIERIQLSDVFWIEAQGNYMQLHLNGKKMLYRASMNQLEKHLDPKNFIRVHRSTIVRIDQIQRLKVMPDNNYKMMLRCGDEVMVSERHIAAVKKLLD